MSEGKRIAKRDSSDRPSLRELLDMDPEKALKRYRSDYLELAAEYREDGRDELADAIERTVNSVREDADG